MNDGEGGGGGVEGKGTGRREAVNKWKWGRGGIIRRERGVILADKKQDEYVKNMDRLDYIYRMAFKGRRKEEKENIRKGSLSKQYTPFTNLEYIM